jgi:hypothetical protein
MYASSNAHGGAARPEVGGRHIVTLQRAGSSKLELIDSDRCVSDEPKPVASTVVRFDSLERR